MAPRTSVCAQQHLFFLKSNKPLLKKKCFSSHKSAAERSLASREDSRGACQHVHIVSFWGGGGRGGEVEAQHANQTWLLFADH